MKIMLIWIVNKKNNKINNLNQRDNCNKYKNIIKHLSIL